MPKHILTTALAVAAAGTLAASQGPGPQPPAQPTTQGMVLKGKAPVSKEILKVKLPKPQEEKLANGLHLMVLEDRRLPQISFQIIIPGAGGYYEPEDMTGVAQYTASMLREGTKSRTTLEMAKELETLAANVSAASGLTSQTASVSGSALTENFDRVFAIAADVLLNPTFPAAEWDRMKARAKQSLQQQRTSPGFLAQEHYARIMYGSHPGGRITTTPQMIDSITPGAMAEWHQTRYVPDHALIAFAGDISLAEAKKKIEEKLGAWKQAGVPKPTVQEPPDPGAPKATVVTRPNSVQTLILVGTPSMTRLHEDYAALSVANRVLGGTMGRLFRHLREEKGYTYGIGSGFSAGKYRGDWSASTSVRTAVTADALRDLMAEIAEMREKPVPASEFQDVKRAIEASFALSLENPNAILSYYIQSWTYGLPLDYWDTYPAKIAAVTADQAQAAAKKYWDPARLHIVAVGDGPKIAEIFAKYGTVEMFDADGKPMKSGASQ